MTGRGTAMSVVELFDNPVSTALLAVVVLVYIVRDLFDRLMGTNARLQDRVSNLEGKVEVLTRQVFIAEAEIISLRSEVNDCHEARGLPAKYPDVKQARPSHG